MTKKKDRKWVANSYIPESISFSLPKERELYSIPESADWKAYVGKLDNPVTHPSHYTQGKIESIRFIIDQNFNFLAGSIIKYVVRYRYKGNPIQDLEKARWFINRLLREERAKNGQK